MTLWKRLETSGKRIAGVLTALALPGCAMADTAPATAAAAEPRPALWKLADADTTIYLFGTIHMLPQGYGWRTPAIDAAVKASDELVIEMVPDKDATRMARSLMAVGVDGQLPPLAERLPEDKRAVLAQRLAEAKVPAAALDKLETWAAAMTLVARSFKDMGFKAEAGVETGLQADYADKRISGLETVEQQFGFLDTLSEEAQRAFLVSTLEDPAAARAEFQAMLAAWTRGDVERIAATFNSDTALSPELRKALLDDRNAKWAEWLKARMDQPGTLMVAVGAGHLAGPQSVQAMLAEKGLTVERVQ